MAKFMKLNNHSRGTSLENEIPLDSELLLTNLNVDKKGIKKIKPLENISLKRMEEE